MATYDFVCDNTDCDLVGEYVERILPMNAEKVGECERCGAPLRRIFSMPVVHFRGGGWTPTFHSGRRIKNYDPEKDMEVVAQTRKENGMPDEEEPFKPTKAVHDIFVTGIDTKKKSADVPTTSKEKK